MGEEKKRLELLNGIFLIALEPQGGEQAPFMGVCTAFGIWLGARDITGENDFFA